jgi:hypothetical protein
MFFSGYPSAQVNTSQQNEIIKRYKEILIVYESLKEINCINIYDQLHGGKAFENDYNTAIDIVRGVSREGINIAYSLSEGRVESRINDFLNYPPINPYLLYLIWVSVGSKFLIKIKNNSIFIHTNISSTYLNVETLSDLLSKYTRNSITSKVEGKCCLEVTPNIQQDVINALIEISQMKYDDLDPNTPKDFKELAQCLKNIRLLPQLEQRQNFLPR